MSSPCRCAGAIIARPIAVAMKPHGGIMLALIRPSRPRAVVGNSSAAESSDKRTLTSRQPCPPFGADRINAKRDRPIEKRGPNSKTKPIIAAGPQ